MKTYYLVPFADADETTITVKAERIVMGAHRLTLECGVKVDDIADPEVAAKIHKGMRRMLERAADTLLASGIVTLVDDPQPSA